MKKITFLVPLLFDIAVAMGQSALPDSCKLQFGTNLSGLEDYGTEVPFVNLMHQARVWYTKDVGNPNNPFNSNTADQLSYRPDGYPTTIPQNAPGSAFPQRVATIWAITDGWPAGTYTVLWDGTGTLGFWGGFANLVQTGPNRMTFDFNNPVGNILEMTITASEMNDPVRNIRLLMPGTENTYQTQPFYQAWLDVLAPFRTVRFMDWGKTNRWGQPDEWTWNDPALFDWEDRAQPDHYTWATNKGVAYEMMVRLMNDRDLDGWVCVPHRASDDYIQNMAQYFRDNLEPERHLYVEYSNEIWNWGFGQAQWLNHYGCVLEGMPWPEGIVPYIQNCFDIWTNVYGSEIHRITRVAGVQTAWQDVSNRMVFNLTPGSFDAMAATYYFGLSEQAENELDLLGAAATPHDIALRARQSFSPVMNWLRDQKSSIADPLNIPMLFYEGGQHLTPNPFGTEPTYAQALLDIQRDALMYDLYMEWYDSIRILQSGNDPLLLMNFSFVSARNARYGSWGILETITQDTALIPAPKYTATLQNMHPGCDALIKTDMPSEKQLSLSVYPNPATHSIQVDYAGQRDFFDVLISNLYGEVVLQYRQVQNGASINIEPLASGLYIIQLTDGQSKALLASGKFIHLRD